MLPVPLLPVLTVVVLLLVFDVGVAGCVVVGSCPILQIENKMIILEQNFLKKW